MDWNTAYRRYNHNLFRQLVYIHRHLHQSMLNTLIASGYDQFRMNFIDVIPYLAPEGVRLADLVELHQLPKASLARLINTVHEQGFIDKIPDPEDSRANTLFITEKGIQLIQTAFTHTQEIERNLCQLMGQQAFEQFCQAVEKTFQALNLSYPPTSHYFKDATTDKLFSGRLQIQLTAITKYVDLRVLDSNQAAGFDDLQAPHRTVLGQISQRGTRATEIAKKEGISKQSISDISHVLLVKKYLKRIKDSEDKRAHRLIFAERGQQMITHTMAELLSLEKELETQIGTESFSQLCEQSERLWFLLDGQNPDLIFDEEISTIDPLLKSTMDQFLKDIQQNHASLQGKIFQKEADHYILRAEFLKYLETFNIST